MREEKGPHQLWDKLFKVVGDKYPEEILRFVCSDKKVKYKGKYEQERVVVEFQTADLNFWVKEGKVKKLLNIEPYSNWNDSIPEVVFTRNGIITKSLDYRYEVISVVIILEEKPQDGFYEAALGKSLSNKFSFPVISFENAKEILEEFHSLSPFLLKIDRSYEKEVIERVREDKLLMAITVLVLSRLGMTQEEALKMIGSEKKEFEEVLLEVPIMKDVFEEWKDRGKVEGKTEGIKETGVELILRNLKRRFKKERISVKVKKQLNLLTSLDEYDQLLEEIYKAKDFKDFEKALEKLAKKAEKK